MVFICSDISTCLWAVILPHSPLSFSVSVSHSVYYWHFKMMFHNYSHHAQWWHWLNTVNVRHSAFSPKPWVLCLVWRSINTQKKNSSLFSPWLENWSSHSAVIFLQEIYESSREYVVWMGSLCVKLIHSPITVIGVRDLVRHKVLLEL